MTTENIDIDRVLEGMAVINKEKAEIKLILQMIYPYLQKLANLVYSMTEDTPHTIISVEAEGRSLEFIANHHGNKKVFYVECVNHGNPNGEKQTVLFGRSYEPNPTFTPEGLTGRTADLCRHQLLPAFVKEIAKQDPDGFCRKLDEFYASAGRQ